MTQIKKWLIKGDFVKVQIKVGKGNILHTILNIAPPLSMKTDVLKVWVDLVVQLVWLDTGGYHQWGVRSAVPVRNQDMFVIQIQVTDNPFPPPPCSSLVPVRNQEMFAIKTQVKNPVIPPLPPPSPCQKPGHTGDKSFHPPSLLPP